MFGSSALEFAIGMVFVYLMLSLAVTALQEGIASVFRRRARTLAAGLDNLLRDKELVNALFAHPLIRGLHSGDRRPSYIPSRTFALALLDTLSPNARLASVADADAVLAKDSRAMAHALRVLITDSGGSFEKFKENIEVWFNNGMERVSGWYKRYTQAILLALAVPIVIGANADSITMARAIWRDPTLRAALVAEAAKVQERPLAELTDTSRGPDEFVPPPPPVDPPEETLATAMASSQRFINRLESVHLPIGRWQKDDGTQETWREGFKNHWFGWMLTVLAISFGAPFWFDLLNKFMIIRGAGKAPEEKQKSPKQEQPPMGPGESPTEARKDARDDK